MTPANDSGERELIWSRFAAAAAPVRAEAARRLAIVQRIEAAIEDGARKSGAVKGVAEAECIAEGTLWTWLKAVAGIDPSDRLPHLAPDRRGGRVEADIDPAAWQVLVSDYLRPEKPSFMGCYNRLVEDYATPRGIVLPHARTLKRRLKKEVERSVKVARRDGREAARRLVPPIERSVADLHAMEAVNIDGHVFDVFVQWEDGRIGRPVLVGLQDIYSRKLLAWRIGETESALLTRLAFADLFRDFGIPRACVLDNGRAFASKLMTGGAPTRFRFKVKDTDATGVLTALGIATHFTLPYRGSSKPVERAWRDLCEDIAKHPRVAGAYTGNRPDAKPDNYRERAIPIAEFRAHVADRIAKLNARQGRRTEIARGGSFDDAFAASYAVSSIGRATPEQLLMALLEAEPRRCDRHDGSVTLEGNRYWSDALVEWAGKSVIVRFDPDNLHGEVHVYDRAGAYIGAAPAIEKTGFFDKAGASRRARQEGDLRRKLREAEAAHDLLAAEKLAELLAGDAAPAAMPAPAVVRPVRHRGQTAAALKPTAQAAPIARADPAPSDFVDLFAAGVARLRIVPE